MVRSRAMSDRVARPWGKSRHGTPSGAKRHERLGERVCDACARAKSDYDKQRRDIPENTRRNRLKSRAQTQALKRLRALHDAEYKALYAEEKERVFDEEMERVFAETEGDS